MGLWGTYLLIYLRIACSLSSDFGDLNLCFSVCIVSQLCLSLFFSLFVCVGGEEGDWVLGLGLSDLGFGQEVGEEGGLEEKECERCENGFRRE